MNRVASRALIVLVLVFGLLGGTGFFVAEYAMKSHNWVQAPDSPHVYLEPGISIGTITDAEGEVLLAVSDERQYNKSRLIRSSTMHWVGDREGNIPSSILTHYTKLLPDVLSGYDSLNGTYRYAKTSARMELTLSSYVQSVALEAMGDHVGTVAVFNYKTGQILCAVTTPTFDPDDVPQIDPEDPGVYTGVYVNRFLRSKYIPGSIFKIVTLAAALECVDGIKDMTFQCTGAYEAGAGEVTCENPHGQQTLKQAFCNSCNCAFAQITLLVGKENMTRYVQQFGLTEAISFDGLTTVRGSYDVSDAGTESFAWSGIGQYNDQVNPCTFLNFVGAIANGGIGTAPYVVSTMSMGGKAVYTGKTVQQPRIMSESTARTLAEYMGYNVTAKYGAGNFPGLAVCAKSGTGEVGNLKKPNAMFTGFVNDQELPLAFIACIEDGGYGTQICIPVLSKVLEACKAELSG